MQFADLFFGKGTLLLLPVQMSQDMPVQMSQDMHCLSVKSYQLLLSEKEKKFAPVLGDVFLDHILGSMECRISCHLGS